MKKSPFTKKELDEFKKLLLERKARLLREHEQQEAQVRQETEEAGDLADMATDLVDRELNLSLSETERSVLNDINDALERIDEGTYGICVDTGELIGKTRLKAVPEARRSLKAQEKYDKSQRDKKKRTVGQ